MTSLRLLYVVSHPIQYQAPLLRKLAAQDWVRLRVLFERIPPEEGAWDPGFRQKVAWDVPLRDGYDNALYDEARLVGEIAAADVVWLHGWQGAVMKRVLRLARRLGRPVLMRGENWDGAMPDGGGLRGLAKRLYLRRILGLCEGFLAIGSANRDYYLARGIASERIFSVPYAVDNDFFAHGAHEAGGRRAAILADLGLEPERPVILYSGKFLRRKRPDLLAAAWASAPWPDGRRPQLLFVGDGEMRAEIEALAPEARFIGFRNQSQLPGIYAAADCFVLPSEREPWGLAVNEAMASGTAVVVSDQVGCAQDLVDDGCGAVFAAGDRDGLAAALVRVTTDAAARGNAARRRIAGWDFAADLRGIEEAAHWAVSRR